MADHGFTERDQTSRYTVFNACLRSEEADDDAAKEQQETMIVHDFEMPSRSAKLKQDFSTVAFLMAGRSLVSG